MKFEKIKIREDKAKSEGLKEINLTNKCLGNIVALVGENGAGKTRILRLIENRLLDFDYEDFFDGRVSNYPTGIMHTFNAQIKNAQELYKAYLRSPDSREGSTAFSDARASINQFIATIKNNNNKYVKFVDNEKIKKIKGDLINNFKFDQLLNGALNLPIINEFEDLNAQATFNFIQQLIDELLKHKYDLFLEYENLENYATLVKEKLAAHPSDILFQKFKKNVDTFLGKNLTYKSSKPKDNAIRGQLFLNDLPFDVHKLSPGQKTLLAYAILFFFIEINNHAKINEYIILLDEPEMHLHPKAQVQLIDALRKLIGYTGQIWIATHSTSILAHLNYDEIFLVKDGGIIEPSRTTPGESLNELMGLNGHIEELQGFINSISEWAFANFMAQCFLDPTTVSGSDSNDPQYRLFRDFIINQKIINLLDYGAGKGRIGLTIQEDKILLDKLSYSAFELKNEFHIDLKRINILKNLYTDTKEIPINSFDCILLCGVLHEIDPEQWIDVFETIRNSLVDGGYLIFIEDRHLPHGENAHKYGYLILNESQIKILFDTKNILNFKSDEPRYKDRITFCAVKKESIQVNRASIKKTLESLHEDSLNNIIALREGANHDISTGRKYANQAQLYINAKLALKKFNIA